jgi:tetratricopeptide (TPR) repeat protein
VQLTHLSTPPKTVLLVIGLYIVLTGCMHQGAVPVLPPDPHVRQILHTYTHLASEFESKATSRLIALSYVNRAIAEEVATLIEPSPIGLELALSRAQLASRVAGLIAPVIVEESWDGQTYALRARFTLNLSTITPFLHQLRRDPYQIALLQNIQQRTTELLEDITRVKQRWAATGNYTTKMTLQQDYTGKSYALQALYWQREGLTAINMRDYTTALLALIVYGELVPGDTSAYYFRALAHQGLGHPQQAVEELSAAIRLHPNEPVYHLRRAQIYHALDSPIQALQDASIAIDLAPHLSLAYVTRGAIYAKAGDYQPAIQDYTQAIMFDPHDPQSYHQRGQVYIALGDYGGAIADFTQVISRQPQDTSTLYERGKAYASLGRQQEAINDYTAAIQCQSDFPEAYLHRGIAYHALGNPEDALTDLWHAIAGNPQLVDTYFYLGRLYVDLGDQQQALVNFSRAARVGSVLFIRQVQQRLKDIGYDPGVGTGVLDTSTANVLRQYQSNQGIPVTGSLGEPTLRALLLFLPPWQSP